MHPHWWYPFPPPFCRFAVLPPPPAPPPPLLLLLRRYENGSRKSSDGQQQFSNVRAAAAAAASHSSFLSSLILRWPCTKTKDRQLMMNKQMRECVFHLLSSTGNGWWCNSVLIGSVTRCNSSMGFMNHCVLKQAAVLHNHGERSET